MLHREDFYTKLKRSLLEARIPHPQGQQPLNYAQYLALPEEIRRDDERDVVDRILTERVLLPCLGYTSTDWHYNREKSGKRPDFVIRPGGKTAFFWENKRTLLPLDPLDPVDPESKQTRSYTGSVAQLGILFNGNTLIAFRGDRETLSVFLQVNLLEAYEEFGVRVLDFVREEQKQQLELFYELFRKERFTAFEERLKALLANEESWKEKARPIKTHLETFINEVQGIIERLALMAHTDLSFHLQRTKELEEKLHKSQETWQKRLEEAKRGVPSSANPEAFIKQGQNLALRLGTLKDEELQELAGILRPRATWRSLLEDLRSINDEARGLRIKYEFSQAVQDRYARWIELQRRFEEGSGITEEGKEEQELQFNRKKRFARQCAYVFFLKLLLVRVLEDKEIIKPRLISDGGLEAWTQAVRPRYTGQEERFAAAHLLRMALERAGGHYGEILQREVYDWFMPPSELSILDVLETLAAYNFSDLSTDLIGYTYQRFLERTERHRLGHYLTPPEVVDYILDEASYVSDNRDIIGKKVLDPACGSGSFLVHAAYRYRQALESFYHEQYRDSEEARLKLAQDFVQSIQEHFVGMDLNPFSCYLARINLLIQALDDYHFLQSRGYEVVIEGFKVYNTDSLVDYTQEANLLEETKEHTVRYLKVKEAGKFGFVFANPPYITPKQEDVGIAMLRDNPFYASWLSGDINTYIFFIRVGLHFLSPGGRLAYIIPLTSLGDQQSEALRRKLLSLTKPLAITRFYTEHVLFKGVDQAVIVLVLEKDATEAKDALKVRVRGGGYGQMPGEAIQDTQGRPLLAVPFKNLSWWISKVSKPRRGLRVPNQRAPWENIWIVLPENRDYYRLWEHMVNISSKTLYELFEELGLKPPEDFISQGDVNTTHVKPFHVSADHEGAMPLYKGEEVDLLMPLSFPPSRGPGGRPPFVAPVEKNDLSSPQRNTFSKLLRIAQLRETEFGFVLHHPAKVRVRRRLRGTWFERSKRFKPVFTEGLWVFRTPTPDLALALLGILGSASLNFAYAAISTNNNVMLRLLYTLPLPEGFKRIEPKIKQKAVAAFKASEQLESLAKDYNGRLKIDASYAEGTIELDPITLLHKEQLATAKMEHYQQRGYIELAPENFKLQTLEERGGLTIKGKLSHLQDVVRLWIKYYGDCKWDEFKKLTAPDDPNAFWKKWTEKSKEAQSYLQGYSDAIAAIDEAVADWYEIPDNLRYLLQERLPWTHGADRDEDDEE